MAEEVTGLTRTSEEKVRQLEALHRQAEKKIVENDFRGAIRLYQEALFLEPDDEAAYTNTAQAYMILGDFPRARDAFYRALEINPQNEVALEGLNRITDPDPR
jgi:Flp pilus assembly protein TadD